LYKFSSKDERKPETLLEEPIRHYFGRVPITEFQNNPKSVGDAYNVLDLIDLYCATMNDGVIGYHDKMKTLLVLKDVAIGNQDEREQTRATIAEGVLPIMSQANGQTADAKYLETSYDITTPKEFLSLIESKIYQLSHTFNFANAAAVQSMGEPALKLMLKPTLDNAEVKERYYTPKLKRVFKCALSYAEHTGNPFYLDVEKIDIIYSHPLPSNDQQAIANAVNLASAGLLNKKQVLRTISWIKDHDAYVKGIEDKSVEEMLKEEQGNNEHNQELQDANPELPEQNDNAANNATRIGNKLF
jgi:SPP1 family phage portal protein